VILDIMWAALDVVLTPLRLLPDVITDAGEFTSVVNLLTSANRAVDIPVVFGVVSTMFVVMSVTTPAAIGLKLYKLVRG